MATKWWQGDSGTTDAVFTVSVSCPLEGEATIAYTTTAVLPPAGGNAPPVAVEAVHDDLENLS